jgi:hypothetical protein
LTTPAILISNGRGGALTMAFQERTMGATSEKEMQGQKWNGGDKPTSTAVPKA